MEKMEYAKGYWNPYLAGIALGLVLTLSFYVMGVGLGASGAFARTAAVIAHPVNPAAVEGNGLFKEYYGQGKGHPLNEYLVFMVIGVFAGGLVGVLTAGRFKIMTARGPNMSAGGRLGLALVGGVLAGIGTRFALGCTSGQALSGGATMVVGSWVFMMAVFAAAFLAAIVIRREWL
jgi:uncharacterized protein